jgi:hypothetical protein
VTLGSRFGRSAAVANTGADRSDLGCRTTYVATEFNSTSLLRSHHVRNSVTTITHTPPRFKHINGPTNTEMGAWSWLDKYHMKGLQLAFIIKIKLPYE